MPPKLRGRMGWQLGLRPITSGGTVVVPDVVASLFAGSRIPVHQTEKFSPMKLLVKFLPYRRGRRPYLHAAPKGGCGVGRTEARAWRGGCRVLCCFRVLACSLKGKWAGGLTLQDCQRSSFGVDMQVCPECPVGVGTYREKGQNPALRTAKFSPSVLSFPICKVDSASLRITE